jgi:recombinational DNA repair ATPase RecF
MSQTIPTSGNAGIISDSFAFTANGQLPTVVIDEKIVLKQKDKALKELQSRVQLALGQHNQMYQLQRSHIIAEHDRQLLLAKSAIEDERSSALMALEQSYTQNIRGIDHAAQTQKISIEQQANLLELHALQQEMAMKHAERERQWAAGYATGSTSIAGPQFSQPTFSAPSQFAMPAGVPQGLASGGSTTRKETN